MAVAAGAITINGRNVAYDPTYGRCQYVYTTVAFTGSYATAGEVPASSSWEKELGLDRIWTVSGHVGEGGPPPTLLLVAFWNPVNFKLQLFTSAGAAPASLAEKTAAVYGTAPTGQLTFVGR